MVGDGHQWNLVQSGQDIRPHLAAAIRTVGKKGRSGRRGRRGPGLGNATYLTLPSRMHSIWRTRKSSRRIVAAAILLLVVICLRCRLSDLFELRPPLEMAVQGI